MTSSVKPTRRRRRRTRTIDLVHKLMSRRKNYYRKAISNSNDLIINSSDECNNTCPTSSLSSSSSIFKRPSTHKYSHWLTPRVFLHSLIALTLLAACCATASATPARRFRRAESNYRQASVAPLLFQSNDFGRRSLQKPNQNQLDLAAADQMDEPIALDAAGVELLGGGGGGDVDLPSSLLTNNGDGDQTSSATSTSSDGAEDSASEATGYSLDGAADQEGDEAMDSSREQVAPNDQQTGHFNLNSHNSHLRAMRDMFERRQLNPNHNNNNNMNFKSRNNNRLGQSSQELSPISIGLDPNSPFSMPPFPVGGDANGGGPPPPPQLAPMLGPPHPKLGGDGVLVDQPGGGGGGPLPFGLNPLPHLLGGFQGGNFEGPQRGDQSAHGNHHAAASSQSAAEPEKVWPKIFRFTDGRINLSDFEKQKKMRLSSKQHGNENHIESAPIMFDNRPLKRKSFLILHGGVFPGSRRRRR